MEITASGRLMGVLSLVQIVSAILVNFVLTAPLFEEPGFLVNAAAYAPQIWLSVVLALVVGMLSVTIGVIVWSVIRSEAPALGMLLVALSAGVFALTVVEQATILSTVSLSQAYVAAPVAERSAFEGPRLVVMGARNAAHTLALLAAGPSLLLSYWVLFRHHLVPRALAAVGMGAAVLQMIAIGLSVFGQDVNFLLLLPLAVTEIGLALWLVTRGFSAPRAVRRTSPVTA